MNKVVRLAVVVVVLSSWFAAVHTPGAGTTTKQWSHRIVAGISSPSGKGYWLVYADGTVTARGDARRHGDASHVALQAPIVGGAATPSGRGYWLVARDGGVFSFGNAQFLGSLGAAHLEEPVILMTRTRTGKGYWLVARDGGVFTFGDARFYGSGAERGHTYPVVGFTKSPDDRGYQEITNDNFMMNFGKFPLPPNLPGRGLNHGVKDVIGYAPTPTLRGYWIVGGRGWAFPVGDARLLDIHPFPGSVRAVFSNPKRQGFMLITFGGRLIPVGDAPG